MRSKILQEILDETPKDVEIFVQMYGDIVVRVNELMKEKGYSQKELAEKMGKKPSEISKWLNGNHNLTLRSLAKLEAELGEAIINIPSRKKINSLNDDSFVMTVHSNFTASTTRSFSVGKITNKPFIKMAD